MPLANFLWLNEACGKKAVRGIICGVCEEWAHQKCTGDSSEIYALYCKHIGLKWVGNGCKTIARHHKAKVAIAGKSPRLTETKRVESKEVTSSVVTANTYAEVVKKTPPSKPAPETRQMQPNAKIVKPKPKTENSRTAKGVHGILSNSLHHIESEPHKLRAEVASINAIRANRTSRCNTLLLLNKEEPIIRESKTRRELNRRRVIDILRLVGLDTKCLIKRCLEAAQPKQSASDPTNTSGVRRGWTKGNALIKSIPRKSTHKGALQHSPGQPKATWDGSL
ncbi:unnamed protein product [Echinostoma caproni]|uniref:PHD domain-containing protein n=1 Tax=Echinostoma caproni TaxID=27848 RepID=A0A183BDU7_9TREM|nr:unnamed protein product [Echinostoma caproni]